MNSGIYVIVHLENGKRYIGSAYCFRQRWNLHKSRLRLNKHNNPYLQAAWNKYGEEAFEFMVLEYVEDKTKLIECEQRWLDATKPEYNLSPTAGRPLGYKATPEQRRKNSESKKGKPLSESHKASLSQAAKGRVFSEQHKRKLAEAKKGKPSPRRGVTLSEETRRKISESKKANTCLSHP